MPLHLVGAGVDLDTKTAAVTARAPQAMLQDYLNREDHALWAIVSNGHQLRLLRDASSLTRQSFVEFDLDAIFTDQLYADFRSCSSPSTPAGSRPASTTRPRRSRCRQTRTPARTPRSSRPSPNSTTAGWNAGAPPPSTTAPAPCSNLQHGIAAALQELGTGFVSHPANTALRETLAAATDADRDLHRALLRIAYRLIVLFVAEDRDLLHRSDGRPDSARDPVCGLLLHRTAAPAGRQPMPAAGTPTCGRRTRSSPTHSPATDCPRWG